MADLDERHVVRQRHQVMDRVAPQHGAADLPGQIFDDGAIGIGLRSEVGDHRNLRFREFALLEEGLEFLPRRNHQPRVERAAGFQRHVHHPVELEDLLACGDVRDRSGDDDLQRRVVVGDVDVVQAVLLQQRLDLVAGGVDDRRHRALGRLAHQFAAFLDQLQAGFEIETFGRQQGVEFAKAVAGEIIGRLAGVLQPFVVRQRIDHVQRRLRELGLAQLALRIVQAQFLDGIAQHGVGLGGQFRERIEQAAAHPACLRTLSWKHVGFHRILLNVASVCGKCRRVFRGIFLWRVAWRAA